MKKKTFLLLFVCGLLVGCQSGEKYNVVTVEDMFSITLPTFLKETDILNDDAILQYQNAMREFYVIVIEDLKAEMQEILEENDLLDFYPNTLEGYSDLTWEAFEDELSTLERSDVVTDVINGMPVRYVTIHTDFEGTPAFFYFVVVEGKERYYQIMTWTLTKREKAYGEEMKRLIYSFTEL